jgi:amidase
MIFLRRKQEVNVHMKNDYGAFVSRQIALESTGHGILDGKTFAVKDIFSIKGHVSGAGNPDWLLTHSPAEGTAASIESMLGTGAKLEGVTHTDELMFSLNGENFHYGTPVNPKAAECIPGGSSSGSAVAVAAGLVDLALGTDTGGSVRIPASYCGVYGFRPTHGAVSMEGVIPFSPSFDTVGWFANDAVTLFNAGKALINQLDSDRPFTRVYFAKEAWALASPRFEGLPEAWIKGMTEMGMRNEWRRITQGGLTEWLNTFRAIQGFEVWQTHREWIETVRPTFGPSILGRFEWAKQQWNRDIESDLKKRNEIKLQMEELLSDDSLLLIPTAPGEAPRLGMSDEEQIDMRQKTLELTCIAGLSGLPQIHIPLESSRVGSIGISIIAGKNQDLKLLKWACELVKNSMIELAAHSR